MLDNDPLAIFADERYPDLLRRIAGVFGHLGGKVKPGKSGNITELARVVRSQVRDISGATGSNSKKEQIQVVLYCLRFLEGEAGKRQLVYCTSQRSWSLDKSYILSQRRESRRLKTERDASVFLKRRRIKRSRQKSMQKLAA